MRHKHGIKKIGRTGTHRRATLRNMATALFTHERIVTTHAKAIALRPFAEKLITLSKRGDLHARRLAGRHISDKAVLQKLFDELASRFESRPGGYTRILKLGYRSGDQAKKALIELVDAKPRTQAEPEEASEA